MRKLLHPEIQVHDEFTEWEPPPPSGDPKLLWPSIEYKKEATSHDIGKFPKPSIVCNRYNTIKSGTFLGLVAFEEAVKRAQFQILILDPHFDQCGTDILGPALSSSQARDIRILTRDKVNDKQKLIRDLNLYRNMDQVTSPRVEVQWSATLDKSTFPYLHDRFAIIDGDLWHFGSTVGGGHAGLTAASGPWSVTETHAKDFFEQCWRISNA